MRILFYLPAITPWWFEHIITPMLRMMARSEQVEAIHLMVAPQWRNTGVTGAQLEPLLPLHKLNWHIVDHDPPALFRRNAAAIPGLMDTVAQIAPDLTLARSADFTTPAGFPGLVRHITEGALPPFVTDPAWIVLDELPFRHGHMPATARKQADLAREGFATLAQAAERTRPTRKAARATLNLPTDRPVIAVPLMYEHAENFYLAHAAHPDSVALLNDLADQTPPDALLAISDHPLNILHVNRHALLRHIEAHPARMRLIRHPDATRLLVCAADAVVADLSKSWALAAWAGTPILSVAAPERMAPWLNATPLAPGMTLAGMRGCDPAMLRRYQAWHLAARVLRPAACDLGQVLCMARGAPSADDIAANLAALAHQAQEAA
ncbi:hypothetical protein GTZ99_06405 [Novosphingobium sp. FSY-8]|uniref:Uncharacterized protein n=1 Tax=Novosphingobium ovatum TaxID=1908523 RepID=A0ABW9XCC1_9SPHN|nr:hypothetical protein [Novosphingobium ovatum]NBC36188.1 hypothetical protein [Novosphingobium ovatum]